jgi:putative molybdopterin biosynthesis protein
MRRLNIPHQSISGYTHEVSTHSEVAQIIAKGEADVGLGVEAASQPYELDFVPLATEPYVFVVPAELWDSPPVQALAKWLLTDEAKGAIANLSGYEIGETGAVKWTE